MIIVALILLELIVLGVIGFFVLKVWKQSHPTTIRPEIKVVNKGISAADIRDGFKSAIREMAYEDEQEKLVRKKNQQAENIRSSLTENDEPIKSDGDLIPMDLSDTDKELLRMFYSKD